jgi:hypothetical protein
MSWTGAVDEQFSFILYVQHFNARRDRSRIYKVSLLSFFSFHPSEAPKAGACVTGNHMY